MKSKTSGISIHCGGNTRQQRCNVRMFMCTTRPTSSYEVKKPLDNLCLPLLRLGITLWDCSFYIFKGFPGILDYGIGCFSFDHGTSLSFIFMASSNKDIPSFSKASEFAFFLSKSSGCLPSASSLPLSSSAFLFSSFSFFLSSVSMRWADAVHYISREGQALRFTTILGDVGWNRTQAIDGWHFQPCSVACQQQLVLAKSSLYIRIAMVKCECNPCQFH